MATSLESTARRERARRLAPHERRAQIVSVAAALISKSGFNAVSMANVAAACGIAKSLVAHYFPTMAQLLTAVLEYRDQLCFETVNEKEIVPPSPDAVRKHATLAVQHNLQRPELVRLYHILAAEALSAGHPLHEYFAKRSRAAHAYYSALLRWKRSPETAALEFMAFWHGLEAQWLRDPSLPLLDVWNSYCDRFFDQDGGTEGKALALQK